MLTLLKALRHCVERGMADGEILIIGDCRGILDLAARKFDVKLNAANQVKGEIKKILKPMTVNCEQWDRKNIEAIFGH